MDCIFSFVLLLLVTVDTNSNQMKTILKWNNVIHLRKCQKGKKDNLLLIQYSKEPSEISGCCTVAHSEEGVCHG